MAILVLCLGCLIFVNSFSLFRLYYTYLSLPFPPFKFFPIPSLLSFKLIMFYILFFKHMIYLHIYLYLYIQKYNCSVFILLFAYIFSGLFGTGPPVFSWEDHLSCSKIFCAMLIICVEKRPLVLFSTHFLIGVVLFCSLKGSHVGETFSR